jgi:hypothetical protein
MTATDGTTMATGSRATVGTAKATGGTTTATGGMTTDGTTMARGAGRHAARRWRQVAR